MPGRVVLTRRAAPRPRPGGGALRFSPVERLSRRLKALAPDTPQRYAVTDLSGESDLDPGWILASSAIPAMVACAGEHLSVSPAVAGAKMAGSLGYAVTGRLAVALAVTGQAYDVGPHSLMVRLDGDGLVERIGVRNPILLVSAAAVGPGPYPVTRLADLDAVIEWAANRAWSTLGPLVDELHEVTRFGRIPMWNLVADTVLGPATTAPRLAGHDQRAGRATGSAFLDALVERGAPIRRRGTLREPALPNVLTPVRGSCCLQFRQDQEKCDSCPLIRTQ